MVTIGFKGFITSISNTILDCFIIFSVFANIVISILTGNIRGHFFPKFMRM